MYLLFYWCYKVLQYLTLLLNVYLYTTVLFSEHIFTLLISCIHLLGTCHLMLCSFVKLNLSCEN